MKASELTIDDLQYGDVVRRGDCELVCDPSTIRLPYEMVGPVAGWFGNVVNFILAQPDTTVTRDGQVVHGGGGS